MFCITIDELVKKLQELPGDTLVSSIGFGIHGGFGHDDDYCYLAVNGLRCKTLKEIPLHCMGSNEEKRGDVSVHIPKDGKCDKS